MLRRFLPILVVAALTAGACSGDSSDDAGEDARSTSSSSTTTQAPTTTIASPTTTEAEEPACPIRMHQIDLESLPILPRSGVEEVSVDNPLVTELRIVTPDKSFLVVNVHNDDTSIDLTGHGISTPEHHVLIAGLRAETEYTVDIAIVDLCEPIGRLRTTITTGSLPEALPPIVVDAAQPEASQPGVTLFNILDIREGFGIDTGRGDEPPRTGWLVMVDADGEVVWFHRTDHNMGDAEMLDDGTILVEYNDTLARRINLKGEVLDEWAGSIITGRYLIDQFGRQVVGDSPIVVDTDSMHHEHSLLPDGTHATLSTEIRILDGFDTPVCGEDPAEFDGTYHLVADIVVLFDPETGDIIDEFNLFDYFDPRDDPVAFNLCGLPLPFVFPNWLYSPIDPLVRDWTHANAIEADVENNALLVSIRHLDAIIAIRWKDDANGPAGELLWHSGPLGDLELLNGDWHRYQHAPEVGPGGSMLVYDNGNRRPGPDGQPDLYSRAVEYVIDTEAMTISQVWEHRAEKDGTPLFAAFVGDVDRLANGNVLIVDGGLNGGGGFSELSARIVEVLPADGSGGDEVWTLEVLGGPGWVVYRAERLDSVYG